MFGEYEFTVITDEKDILEYEKLLYDAFINRAQHGWAAKNYIKKDNRLISPWSYEDDLIIYALKKNNVIKMAITINKDTNNKLQLENYGFKKTDLKTPYYEGLTFCTSPDLIGEDFPITFKYVNEKLTNLLNNLPVQYIYGTCFAKLKRFYSRLGFRVIKSLEREYGVKYLLEYEIKK